jgi:hypothetical protein
MYSHLPVGSRSITFMSDFSCPKSFAKITPNIKQEQNSLKTSCNKSKGKEEMWKHPSHRSNQEPVG